MGTLHRVAGDENALFSVEVADEGDGILLRLRGECDLSSLGQLTEPLEEALGSGRPLVIDLSELSFLDSSCLRAILSAHESAGSNGGMRLRRGPANVMRVFEIAGLTEKLLFE
jgi:anti-sigma B factor antagonist